MALWGYKLWLRTIQIYKIDLISLFQHDIKFILLFKVQIKDPVLDGNTQVMESPLSSMELSLSGSSTYVYSLYFNTKQNRIFCILHVYLLINFCCFRKQDPQDLGEILSCGDIKDKDLHYVSILGSGNCGTVHK